MDNVFEYQNIEENKNNYIVDSKNAKIFRELWIITEKIHGVHFAIYYNNGKITFSKKNAKIEENEWYYNYQSIKDKLIDNTNNIHIILRENNFIIYGELFGGYYHENDDIKNKVIQILKLNITSLVLINTCVTSKTFDEVLNKLESMKQKNYNNEIKDDE